MKQKFIIPKRFRTQAVRQLGAAKLIRQTNGQHKLVGGTDIGFRFCGLVSHSVSRNCALILLFPFQLYVS
jgi:hypothetical protein